MKIDLRVVDDQQYAAYCPFLRSCKHPVTKYYFLQICNSGAYMQCQHYAKRVDELYTPMEWIQKLAVEESKKGLNNPFC